MKGVISMLSLLNTISLAINIKSFPMPLIALLIVIVIFLLISILALRWNRKQKKKKEYEQEYDSSITKAIDNDPKKITDLNNMIEPYGFAYEPYQDIFYSIMYPWQRDLGYCSLYDEAATLLSMVIDCEPITFEYNSKRWLIEFWKGQYGMNTGGEVGIYYTTGLDLNIPGVFNGTFYYCVKDEDRINMSFVLRKNGNVVLTRNDYHWWLTGFNLGEFSDPSELSMEIILELYNQEMMNAFVSALQKVGYEKYEYEVHENSIMILFNKPHSNQPSTRNAILDYLMQQNNESLCDSYQTLTQGYTNTIDKLNFIRKEAPELYTQCLNIGKPKGVFESYGTIKNYLDENNSERM